MRLSTMYSPYRTKLRYLLSFIQYDYYLINFSLNFIHLKLLFMWHVQFLSMKLASMNPMFDEFGVDFECLMNHPEVARTKAKCQHTLLLIWPISLGFDIDLTLYVFIEHATWTSTNSGSDQSQPSHSFWGYYSQLSNGGQFNTHFTTWTRTHILPPGLLYL